MDDAGGKVLYRRAAPTPQRVIAASVDRDLVAMMWNVIVAGTGTSASLSPREAAGKTGTTQNSQDAWFVGFTTDYVTGVWVGNDDNSPTRGVTGGTLPAQIWKGAMRDRGKGPAAEAARPFAAASRPTRPDCSPAVRSCAAHGRPATMKPAAAMAQRRAVACRNRRPEPPRRMAAAFWAGCSADDEDDPPPPPPPPARADPQRAALLRPLPPRYARARRACRCRYVQSACYKRRCAFSGRFFLFCRRCVAGSWPRAHPHHLRHRLEGAGRAWRLL